MADRLHAVVVGSGPNGLAAAVTLARAGLAVRVYERASAPGGAARTSELTLPGFRHDVGSAVHPLALASPFFRAFELDQRIDLRVPDVSFAHPLQPGRSALAYRDLDRTVEELGRDGPRYRKIVAPLLNRLAEMTQATSSSLLAWPKHAGVAGLFGARAIVQGSSLWNVGFRDAAAPALLTGAAAHTIMPLPSVSSAAAGLALTVHAHARGWPIPVGGSGAISEAMIADIRAHGGEVITDVDIDHLDALPDAVITVLDVTPRAFVAMAGDRMPSSYRRTLSRFRYGNGVAKVDFALCGPVPWKDPALRKVPTLHLGGTREEIAQSEGAVARGEHPVKPYVLVSQPGVLDPTRAPEGSSTQASTLWAYTHVPAGSARNRTEAITAAIEAVAPGFRDVILATSSLSAVDMQQSNPNHIGGDIAAGLPSLAQLVARPRMSATPWKTPLPGVYLCGASTAPGPGVHGLSGWYAAQLALREHYGLTPPDLSA